MLHLLSTHTFHTILQFKSNHQIQSPHKNILADLGFSFSCHQDSMHKSMITVWKRKRIGMDRDIFVVSEVKAPNTKNKKRIEIDDGKKCRLLSFKELPDYMKDNEYILNYYRANWPLKQALFSIFRWHNETLNVWTHLLGFLLFVGFTLANLINVPQVVDFIAMISEQFPSTAEANASKNFSLGPTSLLELNQESRLTKMSSSSSIPETRWPFYVFLMGSMFCLLSSSICHLFSCHSHALNRRLLHLDYVGITVMIITSFFPPIYYIFQCTPHWHLIYLTGITLMGLCTIAALLSPALSAGKYRPLRALLFVSMGLFGLIPALHGLLLNWHDPQRDLILAYESVMALSYLVGTVFYVTRVPERWRPGRFDLAGHSHQIFHVFVLIGALAHYGAAQVFFKYRSRMGCAASA